jgi:hypothetical protein
LRKNFSKEGFRLCVSFFIFQFCDVAQVVINVFFSKILPKNDHEKKRATTSLKGKNILKRRFSPYA